MAYTPINWDENTPVDATKLNNMESGIIQNESDINNIESGSMWPVGSIYINATDDTNPATLLGFGNWSRFGKGRVLVSQDSTDVDFDTAGETGGEKEHQLTVNEMPSHSHSLSPNSINVNGNAWIRSNSGAAWGESNSTGSTGGNSPHNNLQPYITVYMWVRTG